ncbi:protein kinase [Aspergillus brunneoviolaceus CBS 621.78]|uniref:Protein kinase n=1 Tax=Aspergillus brunneoviolaceus CBS 621.78 TaxID=1450534 RepID=A0ACD1G5Q7_9EURO|nr:protein kinase [Aspergillus brunneoviolaceus CBS 621.78]RAH44560.1 protein kinase [Aspergillus brunneoviolaceus CBS 621.78]
MNPTRVLYEPIEDLERMEYYQPGGYHPLGHGTYSTIWLARDERSRIYVAVKVCTADSKPPEIDVILELSKPPLLSDIGRTLIPSILNKFNIQDPNGEHICLVTKPARMSLSDAKNGSWINICQLEVARVLAAQLAIAIHYIHSRDFVHGDLRRGNILLQLRRDFDQLSTKRLYEQYGGPLLEPVNRLDGQTLPPGVPQYGVLLIWLGEASENITLPEARIIVSDFGEASSPAREMKSESHTPLSIRPPEARFEPTKPLTFSSDIWTLACTIWDIIAQKPLFEGFLTKEDDRLASRLMHLASRQDHFTEHGEPINPSRSPRRTLEDRFESNVQRPRIKEGMSPFDSSERGTLSSMLRSMLPFRPEDRPSARQVLESEWMVKWALPEYEKIRSTHKKSLRA